MPPRRLALRPVPALLALALLPWASARCASARAPAIDEELASPPAPPDFPTAALVEAMCSLVGRPQDAALASLSGGALPGVRLGDLVASREGDHADLFTYRVEGIDRSRSALRMAVRSGSVEGVFLEFERTWFWAVHERLELLAGARFGITDTSGPAYRIRELRGAGRRITIFEPRAPHHAAAFGCQDERPPAPAVDA